MKKIVGILVVLSAVAVIGFFVFSNPLGRLAKLAIESFGPDMVRAEVRVSSVRISATDGRGSLNGLNLGNPKGFKTDHAVKVDTIELELEPASIAGNVIVLHKVLIDEPNIVYEKGDGGSNFDAIQRNVEAYLGGAENKDGNDKGKDKNKKMIIDTLIIRNAKINYNGKLDLSLPDIELHNIGMNGGGTSPAQITKTIIAELNAKIILALANTAAIGQKVNNLSQSAGDAIKGLLGK